MRSRTASGRTAFSRPEYRTSQRATSRRTGATYCRFRTGPAARLRDLPGESLRLPPAAASAAAGAACEQADQPDEGEHDGHDEQPVHGEAHAEGDDREQGQQHEEKHGAPLGLGYESVERPSPRSGFALPLDPRAADDGVPAVVEA